MGVNREDIKSSINKDILKNIGYKDERLFVNLLELAMYYYSINKDKKAKKSMDYIFSLDPNNLGALRYQLYISYKKLVEKILKISEIEYNKKFIKILDLVVKIEINNNDNNFDIIFNNSSYIDHLRSLKFCVKEKNKSHKEDLFNIANQLNKDNYSFEETLEIFWGYYNECGGRENELIKIENELIEINDNKNIMLNYKIIKKTLD